MYDIGTGRSELVLCFQGLNIIPRYAYPRLASFRYDISDHKLSIFWSHNVIPLR
jgi:hypothetical protein